MIRVFIGYDFREAVAFEVLARSIWRRSSRPVGIVPLMLDQLPMWRERDPLQSTDFSFSRFLVPSLCNFEGWAVFMDCDMLCLGDISELWANRDGDFAVQVVQHRFEPKEKTKFLGEKQTRYRMKNWSSLMLFNCEKSHLLTPEYVNSASGLNLHQFDWCEDIGSLPGHWNRLVGWDDCRDAKMLHWTSGGPWFQETRDTDYADVWREEALGVPFLGKVA